MASIRKKKNKICVLSLGESTANLLHVFPRGNNHVPSIQSNLFPPSAVCDVDYCAVRFKEPTLPGLDARFLQGALRDEALYNYYTPRI